MAKTKAPHHRGSYHRDSAKIRAAAYADPTTTCWRCGLTLEQKRKQKPRDKWTAGHVLDGVPGSPLLPEHASCNYSAGAAMGNKRRAMQRPKPNYFRETELTWSVTRAE